MNQDFPQNEREKLEAKLTALLLGELSADESVALCETMAHDAELAALYEQLKLTIELVRESAISPATEIASQPVPLKLSSDRREKLLARFKTVTPKEFAKPRPSSTVRLLELAAVLALMAVLAAMLLPALASSKEKAKSVAVRSNLRQLEIAKEMWASEKTTPGKDTPTLDDLKPYLGGNLPRPVSGESYILGKVGEPVAAELDANQARKTFGRRAGELTRDGRGERIRLMSDGALTLAENNIHPPPSSPANLKFGTWGLPGQQTTENSLTPMRAEPAASPPALPVMAGPVAQKTEIVLPGGSAGENGRGETATESTDKGIALAINNRSQHDFSGTTGFFVEGDAYEVTPPAGQTVVNFETGDQKDKVPVLGDVSTVGRLFRSESTLADAKDSFQTGLTRDDVNGRWYFAGKDKEVVESISVGNGPQGELAKNGNGTLAGANTYNGVTTINGGSLALNGGEAAGFNLNVVQLPKEEIALRELNGDELTLADNEPAQNVEANRSGGGGSAASGKRETQTAAATPSSVTVQESVRRKAGRTPVGGKQVELAAAASESDAAVTDRLRKTQSRQILIGGNASAAKPEETFPGSVATTSATVPSDGLGTPYYAAKRNLDDLQKFRQVLQLKVAQETAEGQLPKNTMVTMVEPAKPDVAQDSSLGGKLRETFTGKVERMARIKVEQDHPDIGIQGTSTTGYDVYFLESESKILQSDAVLSKVIEAMDLNNVWAKKYNGGRPLKTSDTEEILKRQLEISPDRNTKLFNITARSDDPAEAARIANAVADSYREYRVAQFDEIKKRGIQSLKEQVAEQDKKIASAQAEVDEVRQNLLISDAVTVATTPPPQTDVAPPKPAVPPPVPQPEILTRENAFSTFSLNVSDVSFKLAAASLEKGQMPEPASIRSEEFINAFDYRDPEPAPGAPVAFASERARYPFAYGRDLLRFSLKTAAAGRAAGRPLNIVLLLDNSGSMERADRVRIIQEALRVLAAQLQPQDKFSVVTFARTPQLRVDGVPGNQAGAASAEIGKLTPEGGTNLGDALNAAYETALRHYLANGDNRVVLLTDGAANLGNVDADSLKQKVESHRKQGIALDGFGIGWEGYNDDLLEALTRNGDGRYGFINTPEEANTEFAAQIAGALHVAASDVKVQIEFNPKRVTSYRQIGYAKHQLAKEQFRDNTVDAAEIAAQEAGNALYTIETNPNGDGPIATVRVRYKVPGTSEYREQSWDVPCAGNATSLEQASPAMRLAATASAFSEWLATSPFAAEVTTDQLLKPLRGVPEVYGADARPKKLEWMIRQAKSIGGK